MSNLCPLLYKSACTNYAQGKIFFLSTHRELSNLSPLLYKSSRMAAIFFGFIHFFKKKNRKHFFMAANFFFEKSNCFIFISKTIFLGGDVTLGVKGKRLPRKPAKLSCNGCPCCSRTTPLCVCACVCVCVCVVCVCVHCYHGCLCIGVYKGT